MATPKRSSAGKKPAKLPTTQAEIEAALEAGDLHIATRDEVAEIEDTTYEFLVVPEWDNLVLKIQSLRKGQQQEVLDEATIEEEVDDSLFQVLCVIAGCAQPEFGKDDVETLKGKNAKAFNRVLRVVYKLSAMGPYAGEELEATFREEA